MKFQHVRNDDGFLEVCKCYFVALELYIKVAWQQSEKTKAKPLLAPPSLTLTCFISALLLHRLEGKAPYQEVLARSPDFYHISRRRLPGLEIGLI